MKQSKIIAVGLLVGLSLGCRVNAKKARIIADERLAVYCEDEGLQPIDFSNAYFAWNSEVKAWVIEYRSSGKPRHSVMVYVDRDGSSEVSRMIEDDAETSTPGKPLRSEPK